MAPFWHRWSYFLIINLSVFHLADKCFTITNLINLRIILFLEYRKTPETLRFRGILRLDTMYLAVLNIYSVSYTHLQPYRPSKVPLRPPGVQRPLLRYPCPNIFQITTIRCPYTVSYTHLDVYKRQPAISRYGTVLP